MRHAKAAFRAKQAAKRELGLNPRKPSVKPTKNDVPKIEKKPKLTLGYRPPPPRVRGVTPSRLPPTPTRSTLPPPLKPKITLVVSKVTGVDARQAIKNPTLRRRVRSKPRKTGTIDELQRTFGLSSRGQNTEEMQQPQDVIVVALDTEFHREGLIDYVTEVGLTILDTRHLIDLPPGKHARNWFNQCQTYQFSVDTKLFSKKRKARCYFAKDVLDTPSGIKRQVRDIVANTVADVSIDNCTPAGRRNIILVGHSLESDIQKLSHDPNFRVDPTDQESSGFKVSKCFDTHALLEAARANGAEIREGRLGPLVAWLGLEEKYRRVGLGASGTHTAGNDAAYTMMALMMFAVDWNDILKRGRPGDIKHDNMAVHTPAKRLRVVQKLPKAVRKRPNSAAKRSKTLPEPTKSLPVPAKSLPVPTKSNVMIILRRWLGTLFRHKAWKRSLFHWRF